MRIDPALEKRLADYAAERNKNPSAVIREALERFLPPVDEQQETAYDIFQRVGFIGSVEESPGDLSTNKKHFEGFGKS